MMDERERLRELRDEVALGRYRDAARLIPASTGALGGRGSTSGG